MVPEVKEGAKFEQYAIWNATRGNWFTIGGKVTTWAGEASIERVREEATRFTCGSTCRYEARHYPTGLPIGEPVKSETSVLHEPEKTPQRKVDPYCQKCLKHADQLGDMQRGLVAVTKANEELLLENARLRRTVEALERKLKAKR